MYDSDPIKNPPATAGVHRIRALGCLAIDVFAVRDPNNEHHLRRRAGDHQRNLEMIRLAERTTDIPNMVKKTAYLAQKFAARITTCAAVLPDSADLMSRSRSCQTTYEQALNVAARSKTTTTATTTGLINRLPLRVA
jgi:hypothetical protein